VVKFVSIASQDYAFDLLELFCSKMANIHNVFYFTLFLWLGCDWWKKYLYRVKEAYILNNRFCGILQILVETGHMGRQASGSVTVTDGETVSFHIYFDWSSWLWTLPYGSKLC